MESSCKADEKAAPGLHREGEGEGVQRFPEAIYEGSIGKIDNCITVNMQMSFEMLISLT